MFGDYYTNNLLGSTQTSMFGNLIDNAVTRGGARSRRPVRSCSILMVIVIVPMLYYLHETKRRRRPR